MSRSGSLVLLLALAGCPGDDTVVCPGGDAGAIDARRGDAAAPFCGDFVRNPAEACDGFDVGPLDCAALGYAGGTLRCTAACVLDTEDCVPEPLCGDGERAGTEICDGLDLGGATCSTVTIREEGQLACTTSCAWDLSDCHTCGDGVAEGPEVCDGSDTRSVTCASLGHRGGVLGCSGSCALDESRCVRCGDGRCELAPGETLANCPADCARWVNVSAGGRHTCAVKADGAVYCTGENASLQLGAAGATSDVPLLVPGVSASAVRSGALHSCALDGGALRCWGDNTYGQLGRGTTGAAALPALVSGTTVFTRFDLSDRGACGVADDGGAWCWGSNEFGQIGNGTGTLTNVPAAVSTLVDVDEIRPSYHTCAVAGGVVTCWGVNTSGQCGLGAITPGSYSTPQVVPGLPPAVQVTTGTWHVCVLDADGGVWCWGYNPYGEVGDYGTANRLSPRLVAGLPPARAVEGGQYHTCALLEDRTVWCWGYNNVGQLGDGSTADDFAPAPVLGLSGVDELSVGLYHACALTDGGEIRCWGQNAYGQLGDGTLTNRALPVTMWDPY